MTAARNALEALSLTNPILNHEFRYQRFIIERSRTGWLWIGLAALMVIPALLASLVYTVATLFNWLPVLIFYDIPASIHALPGVLILIANLSMYPVVTLITLGLSHGSISREKQGQTWTILRLTNIESRRIVIGKWWASMWALNGDHVMVIILRLGLAAYYLGILLPSFQFTLDNTSAPYALYFVLIAPLLIMQALLDGMLTAAIGVIAAVPEDAPGAVVTSSVLVARLLLAILIGVWFVAVMDTLRYSLTASLLIAAGGVVATGMVVIGALLLASRLLDRS